MARKDNGTGNMSFDFDLSKIKWDVKGRNALTVWGTDVFISTPTWQKDKKAIRFAFRNSKLPDSIEYMQVSSLGQYILFKKADAHKGWKVQRGNSNMAAKNMLIAETVMSKDTLELIKKHRNEGFDLFYDSKNDLYYIDTTKAVEG